MIRLVFSLLALLLSISFSSPAQKFASECIPVAGSTTKGEVRMNSQGEMGWLERSKIIKLDKAGKVLWEFPAESGFVFVQYDVEYAIDNAGYVYAVATKGDPITEYKFYKLSNTNGTPVWTKVFAAPRLITSFKVDSQSNIYLAGYHFNGVTFERFDTYVTKFNASGVLQWEKTFSESYEGETELVLTAQGQPIISAIRTYPDYSYSNDVIKLDGNGNQLWKTTIALSSSTSHAPYVDNSGNVVSVLYDYTSSTLHKLNGASGEVIASVDLPIESPVVAFSGTQTFVAGFYGPSSSYAIQVLDADFTSVSFITYGVSSFIEYATVYSMIVDNSDLYISGDFYGGEGYQFIQKYSNLVLDWSYTTTAGILNLSSEKYLFSGDVKCLKKIVPCALTSISFSKQPVSAETCAGADVSFTAEATGFNLNYFWHKDGQRLTNSSKYIGANSSVLTIKQSSINDAGNYYCTVEDGCNKTLNSQSVTLSLKASPAISAQPQNASHCSGTDAVFQITTTGGTNVKYQWKKGNTVLVESALIVGSKTNKLTLKTIAATDAGEYFCEITADCYPAAIPSQKANLNVTSSTSITKEPVNLSSCTGKSGSFSIQATGAALTYQWRKGATALTDGATISGSKTSVLTLSSLKTTDVGDYTCVVSGTCGTNITSAIGTLAVVDEEKLTSHPQSKTVCSAQSTSFSVTTSGSGATHQWKKGNTVLTNAGKYSGVTTATLNITNVTATEEGAYSCTIITSCGTELISNSAQLSLGATATLTGKSADLKLCEDQTAKFSVAITGQPASYQWKKGGVALNDTDRISGSKTRELFIADLIDTDAGNFTCEITSNCGTKQESGIMKLEITKRIRITTQPLSQHVCEDTDVTLKVIASGYSPTYQWKKGGTNLADDVSFSGSKTATLTIRDFTLANEGIYTCFVNGCNGTTASESVTITGSPQPDLVLFEDIDCSNPQPQWSSIVTDLRNTNGNYMLFLEGSTEPIDILDITKTGIYTIVKQSGICADTITWQNDCLITGNGEGILLSFSISPNPSPGPVRLIDYGQKIETYEVYDVHGRPVLKGILTTYGPEHLIDMSTLSNGVYSILVYDSRGKRRSSRIIIQH